WLLQQPVVHADESPWRLMGKGHSKRWWIWSLSTANGVFYLLAPTRKKEAAAELLRDFTGTVVVDGCSSYTAERARRAAVAMANAQAELFGADDADLQPATASAPSDASDSGNADDEPS